MYPNADAQSLANYYLASQEIEHERAEREEKQAVRLEALAQLIAHMGASIDDARSVIHYAVFGDDDES